MMQLESTDSGEHPYSFSGRVVTVVIRNWNGSVEARIRPGGKKVGGVATQTMPKGELPKAQTQPKVELPKTQTLDSRRTSQNVDVARPSPRRASESFELDLPGGGAMGGGSRGMQAAAAVPSSEFEADITDHTLRGAAAARMAAISVDAPSPSSGEHPAGVQATVSRGAGYEPRSSSGGEPPINALFRAMVKQGGSDLHLSTGERPMTRKDGDMARLDDQASRLKGDDVMQLLRPILPANNLAEFESDHDTDFAYEIEGVSRFRGNVFLDRRGVGCVFRTIPTEILSADKLGLSPAIQNLCFLSKGLVLVTGPTGSGKSTTLSTLIDIINKSRHDHVITIEDPIEFVHQNKLCLINQRQVGPHTDSFKRALRAALREDPDVVMVGEMRDLETMAIALETAETGHLVFGTLHTTTSYSTVDRLIDSFPTDRQAQIRVMLSESLKGVVSQTLCKKIGGGRVAAYEVLLVNSAISNIIREGKTFQIPSVMQTAKKQGMVLLNDALYELVEKKKVDAREAYIRSADKSNFVSQLRAAGHKLEFLQGGGG
jgi:twitching motility protein PilT